MKKPLTRYAWMTVMTVVMFYTLYKVEKNACSRDVPTEKPDRNYRKKSDPYENMKLIQWVPQTYADKGKHIAFRRKEGSWMNYDQLCTNDNEVFDQAVLKTPAGHTPIFIHDVKYEPQIARSLKMNGYWEPEIMYASFEGLRESKDHVYIDVGANVGTFSLAAAKLGNRVIAMEPFPPSAKRLCRGVIEGGFSGRMFIVHNAVSNVHESVTFDQQINYGRIRTVGVEKSGSTSTPTILLNDLLEVFDITSAVLKLDCESCELNVLKGAERFFETVDVRMVLIEWNIKRKEGAPFIVAMMKRFDFVPYSLHKHKKSEQLDIDNYENWKERNVVFKKRNNP